MVGVVGAQLTGLTRAVSENRARRVQAAADKAAAREAKRRPLYENLIGAANKAYVFFMDLRRNVVIAGQNPQLLAQYNASGAEIADEVYSCVIAVRIDGSDRASSIAKQLNSDLIYFLDRLPIEDRLKIDQISEICGKLKHAEEQLIEAARQDFGG